MSSRVSNAGTPVTSSAQYRKLPTDDHDTPEATSRHVHVAVESETFDCDVTRVWGFVESKWFRAVVVLVIFGNVIMILLELNDSALVESFNVASLCITGFLSFELWAKCWYHRASFFCNTCFFAVWNYLDILFVVLAVADNLLTFHCLNAEEEVDFLKLLTIIRFLRIMQIINFLNILLDYDLSWSEAPWFQSFIGIVIGFNSLLMGFETDVKSPIWSPIEQCLLTVYTAELLVRLKKQGVLEFLSYNNNDFIWNWLDAIIVVSSAADSWGMGMVELFVRAMADEGRETHGKKEKEGLNLSQVMMLMRMLRLLRILRLVKLVKAVKPLYILVMGVSAAVQGVFWVLVLTLVTLYAISIMATRLIGHGLVFSGNEVPDAENLAVFATVPDSMFTLFRVMSNAQSEDESAKMEALMSTMTTMKFAFVFFLVTSSWTLLSILTAVVSEKMIGTCNSEQAEMGMLSYEEDRSRHMIELKRLFQSLDENNDGALKLQELEPALQEPVMAAKIAKICRVPVRNIRDCFHTLSRHGEPCALDVFVANMLEVAKPATEQSVMKIIAQILDAQHEVDRTATAHEEQVERLLQVLQGAETRNHSRMMEVEQTNLEQQKRQAEAILEMEQKHAAQEQRNAEALFNRAQTNAKQIEAILEVLNAMSTRADVIERQRAVTENEMTVRMAAMELANNEALLKLQQQIETIASLPLPSAVDGSSSAADDKSLEQISTDIGGDVDQESQPATSSHDGLQTATPSREAPGFTDDSFGAGQAGQSEKL